MGTKQISYLSTSSTGRQQVLSVRIATLFIKGYRRVSHLKIFAGFYRSLRVYLNYCNNTILLNDNVALIVVASPLLRRRIISIVAMAAYNAGSLFLSGRGEPEEIYSHSSGEHFHYEDVQKTTRRVLSTVGDELCVVPKEGRTVGCPTSGNSKSPEGR
jgi:hypothetical protein